MTEPRRLHSLQSILMKTVFPVLWIGGFAMATLAMFAFPSITTEANPPFAGMKWIFLGVTVAGAAFIYKTVIRLKLVRMDERKLYISNLATEIQVPLTEVEGVTENRWLNIHPVTIHLQHDSAFGRKIVFMPTIRWFAFWSEHPVVDDILEAANVARGGLPTRTG